MKIEGQAIINSIGSLPPSVPETMQVITETRYNQNSSDLLESERPSISKRMLESTIKGLNQTIQMTNTHVKFTLHEGTKEYYVKIINDSNGDVIKEIPSKEFLDKVEEMIKLSGLFIDERR